MKKFFIICLVLIMMAGGLWASVLFSEENKVIVVALFPENEYITNTGSVYMTITENEVYFTEMQTSSTLKYNNQTGLCSFDNYDTQYVDFEWVSSFYETTPVIKVTYYDQGVPSYREQEATFKKKTGLSTYSLDDYVNEYGHTLSPEIKVEGEKIYIKNGKKFLASIIQLCSDFHYLESSMIEDITSMYLSCVTYGGLKGYCWDTLTLTSGDKKEITFLYNKFFGVDLSTYEIGIWT